MLATEKKSTLQALVADASHDELVWINGYISGLLSTGSDTTTALKSTAAEPFKGKITLAYGTETGNTKYLATKLTAIARQKSVPVKVVSLDQYKLSQLSKEEYFIVLISTQGDGEPPLAAQHFCKHIQSDISVKGLKYAVLGLGDSSYPLFCKTGIDVDHFLDQKGGERLLPLEKCDTDFEAQAIQWFESLLSGLTSGKQDKEVLRATPAGIARGKHQLYTGTLTTNINLNDEGSGKQTHHIEIEAAGLTYQPGDALSLTPGNPLPVVAELLELAGIAAHKEIVYRNERKTVAALLEHKLNIGWLPERVVKQYAAIIRQEIPETKISLSDLLKIYPVKDAQQFEEVLQVLEPVTPRLYSIASAPGVHGDEVHLIVARDSFRVGGEIRYGLCSDFLAQALPGSTLQFHIHPNHRFRLPAADKDVIMIGPGTGIAPFRSFLSEREGIMAQGRNWLFFGDRNFATDFLYQTEIQNWIETGLLTRFNAAFSRDQEEKIYVQHRMLENGKELFDWLEQGAFLYVCGNKDPMCRDVEQALLRIIREQGNRDEDGALDYFNALVTDDRYLKDVY
jgi:sulfite reductase (NADPH) flavoprotein alpha-component